MNSASTPSPYRSLLLDIGLPIGLYVVLRDGLGVALVLSLVISSIPPAIRELAGLARDRRVNTLAALMLVTNLAGIAAGLISGDARLLFADKSIVSSTIAISILVSVWRGRPLMSEALAAFLARGQASRVAAWERLHADSPRFRSLESRYSLIWGLLLLADCAARCVAAVTLPVSALAWASTAILIGAIALAVIVSGGLAVNQIQAMLDDAAGETAGGARVATV